MRAPVTIGRLKLRVPAAAAGRPEEMAQRVVHEIAHGAAGAPLAGRDRLRIRVSAGRDRGDALAQRIAAGVHGALRGREDG